MLLVDNPITIDLHLHTVASGHAFSTVHDLILQSQRIGVEIIGIAEHGPSMVGAPHDGFFTMGEDIRRISIDKPKILFGCELNILSENGDVDLSPKIIEKLDFVLAGLHKYTPYESNPKMPKMQNTKAIVNCIEKLSPTIISHPISANFPVEIEPIVKAAAQRNVALEVNARLFRYSMTQELISAYANLINKVIEYNVYIVLSSDSHIWTDLGDIRPLKLLQEALNDAVHLIANLNMGAFSLWRENLKR